MVEIRLSDSLKGEFLYQKRNYRSLNSIFIYNNFSYDLLHLSTFTFSFIEHTYVEDTKKGNANV